MTGLEVHSKIMILHGMARRGDIGGCMALEFEVKQDFRDQLQEAKKASYISQIIKHSIYNPFPYLFI